MPKPSVLLLSHGAASKNYLGIVRGEMANTARFGSLLKQFGCHKTSHLDIFEIFGGDVKECYEPLAEINIELARNGYSMLDETHLEQAVSVRKKIAEANADFLFILSWAWSGAALSATGIHHDKPVASKLYVHHENEVIFPEMYGPHTVLLTESLLANTQAIKHGIPPWKIIHLPHNAPSFLEHFPKSRTYVETLIQKLGKNISLKKETTIIGSISRLEFGKNCEYALQVVEKLYEEGKDVLFVLKGTFEEYSPYPVYKDWLKEVVHSLKDKPWFLWDPTPSSHEEIFSVFASFDIFLHLSGAEAGSNVVVEALALGLPTVIVDGSTNPSLFKNGACFVNHSGDMPQDIVHPFRTPNRDDLYQKLLHLVDDEKFRKSLSVNALKIAKDRFSPERTFERLPLLFKAMETYHAKKKDDSIKGEVEELFNQDLKRYDWNHCGT